MAKWRLDAYARGWITENLNRRLPADTLAAELLRKSASLDSLRAFMAEKAPANWDALAALEVDRDVDFEALANARLTRPDFAGRVTKIASDKAQLYTLDDFLTAEECDGLAGLVNANLRASALIPAQRSEHYRTSRTCDLGWLQAPVVAAVEARISAALDIPLSHSEVTQGQHYDQGAEYKLHMDFFPPGHTASQEFTRTQGNRTWTFMIYLNTVPQGGGTAFPRIPHVVMPQKGRAVAWNNLYPDGAVNPDTIHAGLPVELGSKTVITKWFRERPAPAQ